MSNANVELVRACYEAFARGDIESVMASFSPDIDWIEAAGHPYCGVYHGTEAVLANVFAPVPRDWQDYRALPETFIADGDLVAVVGTYSATSTATGRGFTARFVHVWRMTGGKATRLEQVADTAPIRDAMTEG